jgi:FKBP-type peptidyl-prolyl cis-trans isomerase FkpA
MKGVKLFLYVLMVLGLGSCVDNEDPNKQLNQELDQIDQHIQSIGRTSDALYDNQYGFRLLINDYGENPPPHNGQNVKIRYEGYLFPSGQFFDSGVKEGKLESITPALFPYIASKIMEGTATRVYVPSKQGYGTEGSSALGVPANAILVYDIELEKVERTTIEQSRFITDSTAIANYLEENQLTATYHPSGVWYSITEQGIGDYPIVYNAVTFDYELRNLTSPGTVIESNTLENRAIFGLIDGFKVALPLINEGTVATFYIPSGLAYGSSASATIPAHSNLIFNITLESID